MADTIPIPDAYLRQLELELRASIASPPLPLGTELSSDFLDILQYHLGWSDSAGRPAKAASGKRLRPLICLLSCESATEPNQETRANWHNALPAAAAIELLHNFSLIHDDIQDKSVERHGRPTVWTVWGMAQGINAGDALFAMARLALDRLHGVIPYKAYADVHSIFDAATMALTEGQFLDLCFESRSEVRVDEYMQMVRGKTAALFSASAQIGARIATGDMSLLDELARYGENLGFAFQIADDILGIWGDPDVTGKPAGDDILARKKSLPLIAAAQQDSSGEIREFLQGGVVNTTDVARVTALLDGLNARQFSEALALQCADSALSALDETGLSNPSIELLREIARDSVLRKK
jgi:geranylgeranyl diphosphate synthase, type I